MARIPEETLQQILAVTDIVDLVGRYVKLRRAGVNWVGLCPFHQEKSPSFNVSPQRSTYHCFGCGAGGNAFRFVMEHDGLTFMDAVKRLADSAGIRIEEEVWDANAERAAKVRNALVKLHSEIAEWYHQLLMKGPIAEAARSYLKSRGINAETAKNWKMGYAPASGDLLRKWARDNRFTENLLVAGGIMARGDEDSDRSGETYPRFRHRLMFPIRNDYGEIIAFSGRLLDANAKSAKYLNSPETVLFNKSRVLFGLDKSKRAVIKANRAIVCEGQLDMITAFEHGFQNVVAPLGTAFTEFHARMLKRHAEEVILCFDSDNAGYKAAERAFNILAPTGLIVKVAPLPQGEDPDSLIRQQGPAAFQSKLDESKDFFDHMIDYAKSSQKLREPRERSALADKIAPLLRIMKNNSVRDAAIQKVSNLLQVKESEMRSRVEKGGKDGMSPIEILKLDSNRIEGSPEVKGTLSLLCRLSLSNYEILSWLRTQSLEDLINEFADTEILKAIWINRQDLTNPIVLSTFLSTLPKELGDQIVRLMSSPLPASDLGVAQYHLITLEIMQLDQQIKLAQLRLKQPDLDFDSIAQLQRQVISLRKEYLDRRTQLQKTPPLPAP